MKFNYWSRYDKVQFSIAIGKTYCPWLGTMFYIAFLFWHFELLIKSRETETIKSNAE